MMERQKHKIVKRILDGENKNVIFNDNRGSLGDYYLANMISQYPDLHLNQKYQTHNKILIILLVIAALMKMVSLFSAAVLSGLGIGSIIFILLLGPVLYIISIYFVYFKNADAYRVLGFLGISNIFNSFTLNGVFSFSSALDFTWNLVNLIISIAFISLSFFIGFRMFPHFGWFKSKEEIDGIPVFTSDSMS